MHSSSRFICVIHFDWCNRMIAYTKEVWIAKDDMHNTTHNSTDINNFCRYLMWFESHFLERIAIFNVKFVLDVTSNSFYIIITRSSSCDMKKEYHLNQKDGPLWYGRDKMWLFCPVLAIKDQSKAIISPWPNSLVIMRSYVNNSMWCGNQYSIQEIWAPEMNFFSMDRWMWNAIFGNIFSEIEDFGGRQSLDFDL